MLSAVVAILPQLIQIGGPLSLSACVECDTSKSDRTTIQPDRGRCGTKDGAKRVFVEPTQRPFLGEKYGLVT